MAIPHPYDQSVNITNNEVENIQNRKWEYEIYQNENNQNRS